MPHWERMLAPFLAPPGPGRGQVAELLGPVPFFATPGHARELALTPGSMFYRLLVDPHDGRRVERTIKTYRPDTHMRRQIHAADVYARTPGTRTPLGAAEIDHVTPYAAGGPTAETNLAVLDPWPGHKSKTLGYLDVVINDRRDLTFTTLLRQVHTTRAHDYNQYLHTRAPSDLDTRRDLANQTLYAAHAQRARSHRHRRPGEPAPWLTLTHTIRGQTRPGPAPGTPTIEELLDTTTDADQTDPDQTTPDQSEA